MESIGLELTCKKCVNIFYICKSCYKGQAYCSDICRAKGNVCNRKKAQEKYEKSRKGRTTAAYRQARYRKKIRERRRCASLPLFLAPENKIIFAKRHLLKTLPQTESFKGYKTISDSFHQSNKVTHTSSINNELWIETPMSIDALELKQRHTCYICGLKIERLKNTYKQAAQKRNKINDYRSSRGSSS